MKLSLIVFLFFFNSFLNKTHALESSLECKQYYLKGIGALDTPIFAPEALLCSQTQALILWVRHLKKNISATFDERFEFLEKHPFFPGQETLQHNAELMLNEMVDLEKVLRFFEKRVPLSPQGGEFFSKALQRFGKESESRFIVRKTWVKLSFSETDQKSFFSNFQHILTPEDHLKRMKVLFAHKKYTEIERMLPLLPVDLKSLGNALVALGGYKPSGLDVASIVSPKHQEDSALKLAKIRYHHHREEYLEAFQIMEDLKPEIDEEIDPIFREAHLLAREALKEGLPEKALKLAQNAAAPENHKTRGVSEEFLGWIFLKFFNEPAKALQHYSNAYVSYKTEFSKAKAAFYASLCEIQMNNLASQKLWLEKAALVPTSFYGQLSLHQLKKSFPHFISIEGASEDVSKNPLLPYAILLSEYQSHAYSEIFFKRLLKDLKKQEDYIHFANLITRHLPLERRVFLFKQMLSQKSLLFKEAYPVPKGLEKINSKKLPLFLGLMLQESNFNEKSLSPAGAIGIAQLMPRTAQETAKKHKIAYQKNKLFQGSYNASLGAKHFDELLNEFTSSLILSTAAYNAGKSKVLEWIKTYGDPRSPGLDKLNFIQSVPYNETRHYIEFVIGNYEIYKRILE